MKKKLDRTQIIFELARHVHPLRYHEVINHPTWALQQLLAWYRGEKIIMPARKGGRENMRYIIGVDFG